mgnify:CR=1 FL=1
MNQNEPIFQNLYIKDTKKTKTFFLSTIYRIMDGKSPLARMAVPI